VATPRNTKKAATAKRTFTIPCQPDDSQNFGIRTNGTHVIVIGMNPMAARIANPKRKKTVGLPRKKSHSIRSNITKW
jgi:hypothetical protein